MGGVLMRWIVSVLEQKRFLLNPKLLLRDAADVVLPKMPGRVHVREGDKLRIADELIKRNVCEWIPLEKVYRVGEQPVLNGLFGVTKPTVLEDGRSVLRLIMNLVGSNATQLQLEGGCESLPNITAWQSIVLEHGESLSCFPIGYVKCFLFIQIAGGLVALFSFQRSSERRGNRRNSWTSFCFGMQSHPHGMAQLSRDNAGDL